MSGAAVARCRVCGREGGFARLQARENMFSMGGHFEYAHCTGCGSLSLVDVPGDLGRYYPAGYYSYTRSNRVSAKSRALARLLRLAPDALLAGVSTRLYMAAEILSARKAVRRYLGGAVPGARILDVGCGSGFALMKFHYAGYRAEGCDPYYTGADPDEFAVHRQSLAQLASIHDVITFNHALEHVADPRSELLAAAQHLRSGGACVVAIPKLPSAAFDLYRGNWFSLDAPRHLFIPSVQGLCELADSVGLRTQEVVEEPVVGNHLWSEVYALGRQFDGTVLESVLDPQRIQQVTQRALREMGTDRGCHATFIFRKR